MFFLALYNSCIIFFQLFKVSHILCLYCLIPLHYLWILVFYLLLDLFFFQGFPLSFLIGFLHFPNSIFISTWVLFNIFLYWNWICLYPWTSLKLSLHSFFLSALGYLFLSSLRSMDCLMKFIEIFLLSSVSWDSSEFRLS